MSALPLVQGAESGVRSTSWHLLVDGPAPGPVNMARDQALLDMAERDGSAVLRLYRWEPHCLSFGRNEPALRRYHRHVIESRGLSVVQGPSGAQRVELGGGRTYAVAAPMLVFGTLPTAYRVIHQMLADAVARLGATATLASPPARSVGLDAGACFASPAGGEVLVGERKLVGSAQLQQGSAVLQHGSLLIEDDQQIVQAVTQGNPPPLRETPLASVLNRSVPFEEVAAAVVASAGRWPGTWSPWEHAGDLEALAAEHLSRFASGEWTWRR